MVSTCIRAGVSLVGVESTVKMVNFQQTLEMNARTIKKSID